VGEGTDAAAAAAATTARARREDPARAVESKRAAAAARAAGSEGPARCATDDASRREEIWSGGRGRGRRSAADHGEEETDARAEEGGIGSDRSPDAAEEKPQKRVASSERSDGFDSLFEERRRARSTRLVRRADARDGDAAGARREHARDGHSVRDARGV